MYLDVVAILLLNDMEVFSVGGCALLDRDVIPVCIKVFLPLLSPHLRVWRLDHRCLLFLCCFFV